VSCPVPLRTPATGPSMAESDAASTDASAVENQLEGGNYEVIRARLEEDAQTLGALASKLNVARKEIFGGQELVVVGNERIRTEHNCVPRNLVNVNGRLLLGYNVRFALKKEVAVSDVFSIHRFEATDDGFDLAETDDVDGILTDPRFVEQFSELYKYYKDARLETLRVHGGKLLAVFRIGERIEDIRVFRWELQPGQPVQYIDNRGERDHTFPPAHDFDWVRSSRDDHVLGTHPHINIADKVFVETVGGDLTIKVEDNTEDGAGIYREPVDDPHQSLDDAEIHYAELGTLVLLSMRPFGETDTRYLVFNTRTEDVRRIDAIGQACVQLPEDHGLIFPGGYYLRRGEAKIFDPDPQGLIFKRVIKSPNGEDVLYVFHRMDTGHYVLLPYNLIRQEVATPIHGHGYTLFENGRMVVFRAESDDPTRVHPIQVWETPFTTDEYAASNPVEGGYLAKIGNAALVRGISDVMAIQRQVANLVPSRAIFEDLVGACTRAVDHHHWVGRSETGGLKEALDHTRRNAELIIDEFEKLQALQRKAAAALAEARTTQDRLLLDVRPDILTTVQEFMAAMTRLRQQRGHLITLQDVRLIDHDALSAMEEQVVQRFDETSEGVVRFLLQDDALTPIVDEIGELEGRITDVDRAVDLQPITESMDATGEGLELLIEVIGGLDVGDPNDRTSILENISEVFGQLNRVRAVLEGRRRELGRAEAKAEFAAQFKLLSQGVSSALSMADSPERCDEQLSRLMVQLEELEGRFGEFEEYLLDITVKRDEISLAFESRRQQLMEARQRRIGALFASGERILTAVHRRSGSFKEPDKLNSYFASDSMVLKLRKLAEQLTELGDSNKAEDLLGKLKSAKQRSLRALRDRAELFEDGAAVIKFGRHRFAVNTQSFDLTIVPRGEGMAIHLTGTEFYEDIEDEDFLATRPFWSQALISETPTVYRAEHLAARMLFDAESNEDGLNIDVLDEDRLRENGLLERVRAYSADRYEEGYERGVHDADAALILDKLLHLRKTAGLLRFPPVPRAAAALFWASFDDRTEREALHRQARSLGRMRQVLPNPTAMRRFSEQLARALQGWVTEHAPTLAAELVEDDWPVAGAYLAEELSAQRPRFVLGAQAAAILDGMRLFLDGHRTAEGQGARQAFDDDLRALEGRLDEQLALARQWLEAFLANTTDERLQSLGFLLSEAAVALVTDKKLDRAVSQANTSVQVTGLLGQHPRVQDRTLSLRLDEFLDRLRHFVHHRIPGFRAYREARQVLLAKERKRLRVDEFQPKVMTTFVRNRLINEVYLPMIGDNLAKQMGGMGAGKRTDTMGMLMLISPPGYGKTTLMEYIASQLGIVFMKVNGPSLGHEVHSLDPSEAPNATARQEVEKINLAFEMANNVMLYLDDIQHTHPELLQKFISLCDGTRRVEGVWKGRTRTYDLKGKRFCVIMAGNPYTETGARFQIPDMLANRADTYNLGDILGGRDDLFALSYVENAITSNPTLAPLAARDQQDIHRLIRLAQGEEVDTAAFSHDYSAGERQEFVDLFQKMFRVRDTLLKVNLEYIKSAATDDSYRTEPPFKLQGSYRNMAKVTEKLVSAVNLEEVDRLIVDHYVGESQTLTTGAENNLLKLWELRDSQTPDQKARWDAIKKDYARQKLMGGQDDDPVARVVGTLAGMGDQIEQIGTALSTPTDVATPLSAVQSELAGLRQELSQRLGSPEQLSGALTGVVESLGHIGKAVETTHQGQRGTARVLQAFGRNLVETLAEATAAAPSAAPAPAPAASAAGGRSWFEPNLEVGAEADLVMRHAVLLEVQRALVSYGRMQQDAARQLRAGEYVLAGALPVMQHLADHITTLVHERLPPEQQGAFMDELRRGVARAIKELSEATGERVDARSVVSSELPTGERTPVQPPVPPRTVRTTEAQVRHDAPPVRKP
jgi:hypothetical protein